MIKSYLLLFFFFCKDSSSLTEERCSFVHVCIMPFLIQRSRTRASCQCSVPGLSCQALLKIDISHPTLASPYNVIASAVKSSVSADLLLGLFFIACSRTHGSIWFSRPEKYCTSYVCPAGFISSLKYSFHMSVLFLCSYKVRSLSLILSVGWKQLIS